MKALKNLSHCGREAYMHDRDGFLASLFVPADAREGLLALYALNSELAALHHKISEEMIGHIRIAWWQEAIDGLYAGNKRQGHPILEALAPVIEAGLMPQAVLSILLEEYRTQFPNKPSDLAAVMEKLSITYIRAACPQAEKAWHKGHAIIARHRRRHGKAFNGWLALKLLVAGM